MCWTCILYCFFYLRRAKFSFFFPQFSDSLLIDLLFLDLYRMDSGPALDGAPSCFYPASFWLWCWPPSTGRRILIRVRLSRGKSVLMGKKTKKNAEAVKALSLSHTRKGTSLLPFSFFYFLGFFDFTIIWGHFLTGYFFIGRCISKSKETFLPVWRERERERITVTSFRHSVESVPKLYSLSSMNFSSFYHWIFYLSSGISLVLGSILFSTPLLPLKNWWWRVNHFDSLFYSMALVGGGLAILLVSFKWKYWTMIFFPHSFFPDFSYPGLFPLFFSFFFFLFIPFRKSQHFFLPIYFFREYLYDAYADRDNIPLALNK